MEIFTLEQIKKALPAVDLLPAIEAGFDAYSAGRAVVPPVGELLLESGDVHIKYGYIEHEKYYVIKIASGFYTNPKLGLPSGNGMMLLFDQRTGEPVCILLDEGLLTDTRTAAAGAIAAKHLAPKRVERIGIVGAGTQARLQLIHLEQITPCRQVLVWGRDRTKVRRYRDEMAEYGFEVEAVADTSEVLAGCNLVVTATPAGKPLLHAADLRSGTHITAVGSDTPVKQELEPAILERADLVVADSISQCAIRGEIRGALEAGCLSKDDVVELGDVIARRTAGRRSDDHITVADLTGVAVQDIKIAAAVYEALK